MAGAIVLEWNVGAATQGSAAMWDSHVRLGGYKGSGIQVAQCGTSTSHPTSTCTSSYLALHLTSTSSAYLENVWVWAADHDLDDSNQGQIDVYSARGILIETPNPVWLIGTGIAFRVPLMLSIHSLTPPFSLRTPHTLSV